MTRRSRGIYARLLRYGLDKRVAEEFVLLVIHVRTYRTSIHLEIWRYNFELYDSGEIFASASCYRLLEQAAQNAPSSVLRPHWLPGEERANG